MSDCPHLVIDGRGRCEWCFEFVGKPGDVPLMEPKKPNREPHPDVSEEAKILDAKWNEMLQHMDSRRR